MYFNKLKSGLSKLRNLFIPRRQEEQTTTLPDTVIPVDSSGFKLNRKQRRQMQFGKYGINNNRRHTKGRKLYKPIHQIIRLKDEAGNYTGQIKQIYHKNP